MISKLTGKIEYIKDSYAVIGVRDIGYKVFLTSYSLGKVSGMKEVSLFIHTYVREDILALYGFLTMEELEMFELLISISGIGPKAASGILSVATPNTIKTAILNEDSSILTKVSGVGKKTAERVILELKNKIADIAQSEKEGATVDADVVEALVAMGYSFTEAREMLKSVPAEVTDVRERIKLALKGLRK